MWTEPRQRISVHIYDQLPSPPTEHFGLNGKGDGYPFAANSYSSITTGTITLTANPQFQRMVKTIYIFDTSPERVPLLKVVGQYMENTRKREKELQDVFAAVTSMCGSLSEVSISSSSAHLRDERIRHSANIGVMLIRTPSPNCVFSGIQKLEISRLNISSPLSICHCPTLRLTQLVFTACNFKADNIFGPVGKHAGSVKPFSGILHGKKKAQSGHSTLYQLKFRRVGFIFYSRHGDTLFESIHNNLPNISNIHIQNCSFTSRSFPITSITHIFERKLTHLTLIGSDEKYLLGSLLRQDGSFEGLQYLSLGFGWQLLWILHRSENENWKIESKTMNSISLLLSCLCEQSATNIRYGLEQLFSRRSDMEDGTKDTNPSLVLKLDYSSKDDIETRRLSRELKDWCWTTLGSVVSIEWLDYNTWPYSNQDDR
ncbi:hypothetical protein ABKN59_011845 [Abortiporus biennis]